MRSNQGHLERGREKDIPRNTVYARSEIKTLNRVIYNHHFHRGNQSVRDLGYKLVRLTSSLMIVGV